jgi:hypothetical protein
MTLADFVHLRVHTAYSLSAGAIRIKELAGLCKTERMPAVAITDSGNDAGQRNGQVPRSRALTGLATLIATRKLVVARRLDRIVGLEDGKLEPLG